MKRNWYQQSVKKKEMLLAPLKKDEANDYKKIYNERLNEVKLLLTTERSVTDPQVHTYLQSVVQKIIAANPGMQGTDARVFFARDWWPNAYSVGDGTIAINAGLLLFLDNEAELAFVLCHELAHYQLDHSGKSVKKYFETLKSEEVQRELKRLSKEEYRRGQQTEAFLKSIAFDNRRHNRDNEAEADRQAFQYMKNTGYDCAAMKTCLQMLDKADDSSLHKPLVLHEVFNFVGYPFKKRWIQKESTIFSQVGKDDSPLTPKERDSLKTHPACTERIALLEDSINSIPPGKKYQVDEKMFQRLKKDFFVEITEQNHRQENLSRNLYYSLLLLQENDNMPVAVYSVSRALNEIYENQKEHRLGTLIDHENKLHPEDYNLLLRMLNRLRLDEIAELNYQFSNQHRLDMKDYEEFGKELEKAQRNKN